MGSAGEEFASGLTRPEVVFSVCGSRNQHFFTLTDLCDVRDIKVGKEDDGGMHFQRGG